MRNPGAFIEEPLSKQRGLCNAATELNKKYIFFMSVNRILKNYVKDFGVSEIMITFVA